MSSPIVVLAPAIARHSDPADWLDRMLGTKASRDLAQAVEQTGRRAVVVPVGPRLVERVARLAPAAILSGLTGHHAAREPALERLERAGLPLISDGAAARALAFDKLLARRALVQANLPVPATIRLTGSGPRASAALRQMGWPCALKPRWGAHGLGVTKVEGAAEVGAALERAGAWGDDLLLERWFTGREVQVAMLGARVLGLGEASGGLIRPCPLPRSRLRGIERIALRAVEVLGLTRGPSRVDLLLNDRDNEIVLEVDPGPPLQRDGAFAVLAGLGGWGAAHWAEAWLDRGGPEPAALGPPPALADPGAGSSAFS